MCFQIFYLEYQSPLQMLLSAHPLRLCTPSWCTTQLSDSRIVDLKNVWSSTGQNFPPLHIFLFHIWMYHCSVLISQCYFVPTVFNCWYWKMPLRLWCGAKMQGSLQCGRRTGVRGVWKPSAPSFNEFMPALSITLLITCQQRAWPEATLTEPTANSPVTWMCFYWHGVNEFV